MNTLLNKLRQSLANHDHERIISVIERVDSGEITYKSPEVKSMYEYMCIIPGITQKTAARFRGRLDTVRPMKSVIEFVSNNSDLGRLRAVVKLHPKMEKSSAGYKIYVPFENGPGMKPQPTMERALFEYLKRNHSIFKIQWRKYTLDFSNVHPHQKYDIDYGNEEMTFKFDRTSFRMFLQSNGSLEMSTITYGYNNAFYNQVKHCIKSFEFVEDLVPLSHSPNPTASPYGYKITFDESKVIEAVETEVTSDKDSPMEKEPNSIDEKIKELLDEIQSSNAIIIANNESVKIMTAKNQDLNSLIKVKRDQIETLRRAKRIMNPSV